MNGFRSAETLAQCPLCFLPVDTCKVNPNRALNNIRGLLSDLPKLMDKVYSFNEQLVGQLPGSIRLLHYIIDIYISTFQLFICLLIRVGENEKAIRDRRQIL